MSDEEEVQQPRSGSGGAWGDGAGGAGRSSDLARYLPNRSIGLKLLLVCVLALAMAIPAGFVWALVYERANAANSAIDEVSQISGGRQTLIGPVLVAPIEQIFIEKVPVGEEGRLVEKPVKRRSRFVIYPETGDARATAKSSILKRGIHDVPVFEARVDLNATFDVETALRELPRNATVFWEDAQIYMGLSDASAIRGDLAADVDGAPLMFEPAGPVNTAWGDRNNPLLQQHDYRYNAIGLFAAALSGFDPNETPQFNMRSAIEFSGAARLAFGAFAKNTDIRLTGDWPTPKFEGGFLPVDRDWSEDGFSAHWRVPYLARGAPGAGVDLMLNDAMAADLAVQFLDQASPYQSITRALKYAPMFIGLVFLAYFLFEATSGNRAHPAQYLLVGLAQTVFYLLLLGISEHVGFTIGFIIAASATVMLLSLYAGAVFKSKASMAQAFAAFTTLYALIYVLMRMEDYALLVGAVASFMAIAATMYMTRNLDWYGLSGDRKGA